MVSWEHSQKVVVPVSLTEAMFDDAYILPRPLNLR